jgi:hypothetical protein
VSTFARVGARVARRRGGFTLVDVLVGASLLVTATLGMSGVAVFTSQLRRVNEERVIALRGLDREAAALEAAPFDDLLAVHDGRGFDIVDEESGAVVLRAVPDDADGQPGSITVGIPDDPGDPNRLLDVTLRVDWVGSFGPQSLRRTLRISRVGAGG